jgi:hypothetical protein
LACAKDKSSSSHQCLQVFIRLLAG